MQECLSKIDEYMKRILSSRFAKLIICIGICQIVGLIGAFFTAPSIPTWYAGLVKPPFNPPNWIFGPVWTLLYLMMGVSAWLVLKQYNKNPKVISALVIFSTQLLLNGLWSPVFFGLHSTLGGFIIIIVLFIMIIKTILVFMKISRLAGFLLFPYAAWVGFASILNFYLWKLNV